MLQTKKTIKIKKYLYMCAYIVHVDSKIQFHKVGVGKITIIAYFNCLKEIS